MLTNTNIERLISEERWSSYQVISSKYKDVDPFKVYMWNISLSKLLYPLLCLVEVSFRNAVSFAAKNISQDENWLVNNKVFISRELEEVAKARYHLLKRKKEVTQGRVIAELSFGFWTSLLDKRYTTLWHNKDFIRSVFPYLSKRNRNREYLSRQFNLVRRLRNRVFHYEAIWHHSDLKEKYLLVLDMISWMEPEILSLIDKEEFMVELDNSPIKFPGR